MEQLPHFKYHPDPVSTGSIKESISVCPCCLKVRGFAYIISPYCKDVIKNLCPWCIADGTAATRYGASFVDGCPLIEDGLPQDVVDEVTKRTPGFASWQQEVWLSCCGDACEYHGDISRQELLALPESVLVRLMSEHNLTADDVARIRIQYEPKGSPALYKFICRHCNTIRLGMDYD